MSEIDPYAIAKRLLSFSDDYADKKAAYELLSETRKPTLYTLATECNETAVAAKEAYGYRHEKYLQHVKNMTEAERVMLRAKGKLEAERVRIDLMRTKSANEREVNKHT